MNGCFFPSVCDFDNHWIASDLSVVLNKIVIENVLLISSISFKSISSGVPKG